MRFVVECAKRLHDKGKFTDKDGPGTGCRGFGTGKAEPTSDHARRQAERHRYRDCWPWGLKRKLENKMLPASEVSRVAAILANDVASKAIVTIIKSFYEDKNPDADNNLVEYQPISEWLPVTVDDGEPLIFCPDDQEQPATKGVDATKH